MTQDMVIVDDFRDLDSWRQARSLVCSLLEFSATLSHSSERSNYALCLNNLAITLLDNMAKGYEGEEGAFLKARQIIARLDELLALGQGGGVLKASQFIIFREGLNRVRQSVEQGPEL